MNKEFGLLSLDAEPIPLTGVKVEGDILGRGARVKIPQRFKNKEDKSIEAVYKFPLPEGAAICGFKAHIDDRIINGEIEDRDIAFEIYDDAIARGDGGYLLDEERPNVFTLSVGNLKPHSEVLIEIAYITLLDMEGEKLRFFLPTTISPRYVSDSMDDEDGIPVDAKVNPPFALDVPYGLSLLLNIHHGKQFSTIESPTHPIRLDMKSDPYQVSLSSESASMDRDFILYLESKKDFVSHAYTSSSNNERFCQIDILLDKANKDDSKVEEDVIPQTNKEIVFAIDCSGSMRGDSIREAKKALEVMLKALSPGTLFNIYRFGSSYVSLFDASVDFSKRTMDRAMLYLDNMDADLGGTEIYRLLRSILLPDERYDENTQKNIIILTDGEVGNERKILELVYNQQKTTRVFSVGIGAGPNEYFIKAIARGSKGAHEFIYPGERIEPKVLRLFSKMMESSFSDFEIVWGDDDVEQAPQKPAVFRATPQTVFARMKSGKCPDKIQLKGKEDGNDMIWEVEVVDSNNRNLPIPTLWARERIRDIEEWGDRTDDLGSKQSKRKIKARKELIVDLSKKYGVLSSYTSFVAIEERQDKDKHKGELVLRKVPVMVTVGWHGIRSLGVRDAVSSDLACHIEHSRMDSSHVFMSRFKEAREVSIRSAFFSDETDVMMSILSLQKAEGGLELDKNAKTILGIDVAEIKRISEDIETDQDVDTFLLLSTAILLRVLEIKFAFQRDAWESVVPKSQMWLKSAIKKSKPKLNGKDLLIWVEEYVRDKIRMSSD